jgi:hypothetical protein
MAAEVLKVDLNALESVEQRPYFKPSTDSVVVPLPLAPLRQIQSALEEKIGRKLLSHDSAFITVISRAEFRVVGLTLKMDTLDKIVAKEGSIKAPVKSLCLKKVTTSLAGKTEESWYIDTESEKLLELRQHIWRRFLANGGQTGEFLWKRWAPHITVGFTSADSHDEDRIIKDKSDCIYQLTAL